MVEHLPQGEVGIDEGSTGVVHQEGIAAMQVTVYNVESATGYSQNSSDKAPNEKSGDAEWRAFLAARSWLPERQTAVPKKADGGVLPPGISRRYNLSGKRTATFAAKAVHAGDGFLTATKREGINHFVWF